jgi:transcriptional regulator with XRE-family HTH domain
MSRADIHKTSDEWQVEVGERLRAARIRADMEQTDVATAANLSTGAIKNLEGGKGSTLSTLIRVLRALDLVDVLESLPPVDMISPLEIVRSRRKSALRSRVVKATRKAC